MNAINFIVGKGTYLVAYHNEGYTNINEAYLRLLRYVEHHSLVVTGYFYEDLLLDE
ncbi:hypothetical protein [Paenibacillus sp. EZ-K15]|uniref:hypothetical protein n=1 Tax=Paenibacillus sp. EZ-K15 TaxID=2044275 RepID=UPI00137AEAC6|nr:hypothetical protein [Paenibacillus sp. EZ-K15]